MIYIKELLPNPPGNDKEGEWIKLVNIGEEEVSLEGWVLKDESNAVSRLNKKAISPGGELELKYSETKISLNNNGDTVTLYNNFGEIVDSLNYNDVSEAEIVFANRFQPRTVEANRGESISLQNIPTNHQAIIKESLNPYPLFIGLFVAVTAGIIAGLIIKHYEESSF